MLDDAACAKHDTAAATADEATAGTPATCLETEGSSSSSNSCGGGGISIRSYPKGTSTLL